MQKKRNSSALALQLCIFCIKPWTRFLINLFFIFCIFFSD